MNDRLIARREIESLGFTTAVQDRGEVPVAGRPLREWRLVASRGKSFVEGLIAVDHRLVPAPLEMEPFWRAIMKDIKARRAPAQ